MDISIIFNVEGRVWFIENVWELGNVRDVYATYRIFGEFSQRGSMTTMRSTDGKTDHIDLPGFWFVV